MFERLGLSGEDVVLLATFLGVLLATLFARRKGEDKAAREAERRPALVTTDDLSEEMIDVKGETRQMRQELRIEAKDLRAHVTDDGRETRAAISSMHEKLILVLAELRRRD